MKINPFRDFWNVVKSNKEMRTVVMIIGGIMLIMVLGIIQSWIAFFTM